MKPKQILDMLASNLDSIKLKSSVALQNLHAMHRSFYKMADDECLIAFALNDAFAAAIYDEDYVKAIGISQDIINQFPDSPYISLIAKHETQIGRSYTFLRKFELAQKHLHRAEALAFEKAEQTQETRGIQADILHKLAMLDYHLSDDMEPIIRYLDRALILLEHTPYIIIRGICLMGLGNVRHREARNEEALAYFFQALEYFEQAESFTHRSGVICNIGLCYIGLGQYETASEYLNRGLDIRTRMGSYGEIAASYYDLFLLYRHQDDLVRAYANLIISRDYAAIGQARGLQMQILAQLETMAREMGDNLAAEKHHDMLQSLQSQTV